LFFYTEPATDPGGDSNAKDVTFDSNDWGIGLDGKVVFSDSSVNRLYDGGGPCDEGVTYTLAFLIKPDDGLEPTFGTNSSHIGTIRVCNQSQTLPTVISIEKVYEGIFYAVLSEEIGGDIVIIEDSASLEVETLIKMVAEGEIEYTVSDEDVAMLNATYYPILDVKTPISFSQQIAWALRSNADSLKQSINNWLEKRQTETDYYVIYNKYFKNLKRSVNRSYSEFSSVSGDKLSPYDEEIKATAEEIGWDWKLLAALIYQESKFDPTVKSWAGAKGLMQMMEPTAREVGASNLYDPYQSLKAGGTIRLTKKYGGDPSKWEANVEKFLLLKSQKKYYTDPVVKYGYCRGEEPINYVKEILERYDQYVLLLNPEDVEDDAKAPVI